MKLPDTKVVNVKHENHRMRKYVYPDDRGWPRLQKVSAYEWVDLDRVKKHVQEA